MVPDQQPKEGARAVQEPRRTAAAENEQLFAGGGWWAVPSPWGNLNCVVRLQNWGTLLGDYCLSFIASCSEALSEREAICKQVSVRTARFARMGTLKLSVLVCLLVFKRPFQHSANWRMQSLF